MATPVLHRRRPVPATAPAATPAPTWPVIAGPAALAAILTFVQITGRSLGFDEGATVAIASQHGSALWAGIAHDGGNMSAYYLLLHVLIGTFGNGLLVLRIVSGLATVATVAVVAVLARRLFSPLVAVAGGTLAAVSLPLIYWGQTARAYAPMVAFVCAGFVMFIELCDPPGRRPGRWPWLGYVAAMTLAMYCSFVAVLVVPAQLLVLVHRRRAWRALGTALGVIALLCVPLLVLAVRRGSGQLFWVPRPNRMVETQVLQSLTSAGLTPSFHHTATTYLLMWGTIAAVVALAADAVLRRRRGQDVWGRTLVLAWAIVPAALTFLYSLMSQPVFEPRNVLVSTPAISLALATTVCGGRRRRAVAALGVALIVALRALQVVPAYGVSPEPWSTVTARVLAQSRPGDCIAFYPLDGRMAFQYYVARAPGGRRRAPRSILPIIPWTRVKSYVEDYQTLSPAQVARRTVGCDRLWLVSSHEGQPDGPALSRAHRTAYFRLDAALQAMFGLSPVQSYGYASTIHVQLLTIRRR
jgi:mannosyltransferase